MDWNDSSLNNYVFLENLNTVLLNWDKINENIRQLSSEKEEVSRNIGNLTIDCSIYIPDDVDISD